jgi:pSer/pThr/pTyr-binding forkhead associated (FHA) protein
MAKMETASDDEFCAVSWRPVRDVSVSRFHAFLKSGDGGGLQIQDAGSTNGTAVNGRPAPPRGEGAPLELKSGDRVRIGQVHLTFLDSESLIDVLRHGD